MLKRNIQIHTLSTKQNYLFKYLFKYIQYVTSLPQKNLNCENLPFYGALQVFNTDFKIYFKMTLLY